jgi:hypothetical protein
MMRTFMIAATMLLVSVPAMATNAVASFTGGSTFPVFSSDETVGWAFSTAKHIAVTALGWNVTVNGPNGSSSSHQVGIWNSGGTLLGSATVTAGSATDGIWRFTGVSPIALSAGQYFIGGRDTSADGDRYVTSVSNLTLAAGLTFLGSAVSPNGSGFAFPANINSITTGGRFGPNFQFKAAGAIPEPASWAMLISGFGLVGAVARRRRLAIAA